MSGLPQEGDFLAGYRIVGMLGRGGMGAVYRAHDPRLGRHVALKVLRPEFADDAIFQERFVRESRMLASIQHPNIVDVFYADRVDGVSFIVMRLIDGVDLGSLLADEGQLAPQVAGHVVHEVAEALDEAHAHGLVHRDVKPGNILLSPVGGSLENGRVYLSDFGLTKDARALSELTTTGQFLGTVDYVAPEQIQGTEVDGRADLYALACVAYECLAGRPPFHEAREAAALMAHLINTPPDIGRVRPDLPPAVADVLRRGMAKSRDQRPDRCADFASALAAALDGARPGVSGGSALPDRAPPTTVGDTTEGRATPVVAVPPMTGSELPTRPVPRSAVAASGAGVVPGSAGGASGWPDATTVVTRVARQPGPGYQNEYGVSRRGRGAATNGPRASTLILGVLAVVLLGAVGVAIGARFIGDRGGGAVIPTGTGLRSAATFGATTAPDPTTADAAAAERRLRNHIPGELVALCRAEPATAPVLAAQTCSVQDGTVQLRYELFADDRSAEAAYTGMRAQVGVSAGTGERGRRCAEPDRWPNEGAYTRGGSPAGRLLCSIIAGRPMMAWTDLDAGVLTSATEFNGDGRRLYRFWRDGRFPRPAGATDAPTTAPVGTPAFDATEPPAPSPAATTVDPAVLAERRLRRHIPAALRSSCQSDTAVAPEIAAQRCVVEDGTVELRYALYAEVVSMNEGYEVVRAQLGVPPDSGQTGARCVDPATWPNEGEYTFGPEPAGRVLCVLTADGPTMIWTHLGTDVLTSAVDRSGNGGDRLFSFWLDDEAGPVSE